MAGALADLRIVDLSSVIMGPYATQILGDLGADVISVEDINGDTNRVMGPGPHAQLSGVSMNLLRNKRNVSLDLKRPEGREAFLRIVETADVVVTNLRPGPLDRLRLGYEELRARKADIIVCQAHGWPSGTPEAEQPAYDDIMQAATGLADLLGRTTGRPLLVPSLIADKVSGLTIVYSVLAAVHHRDVTGEGQHVEVAMVEAMQSFILVEHGAAAVGEPPQGGAGYQRILTPERRPQQTLDGWVNVLPYRLEHYHDLFRAGGREDLLDDPRTASARARIANSETLYRDIAGIIAHRTTAEWLAFCTEHAIPASAVATVDDLVDALPLADHPHAGPYHQIMPAVRFGATPIAMRRPAPLIGEHGEEVLLEVGYSDAEIDALRQSDVLRQRKDVG